MRYIEALINARNAKKAIGAFNIFNDISIRSVISAAQAANTPVILQTSVKTVNYYGVDTLYKLVHAAAEGSSVEVFLNLDHCRDVKLAIACAKSGWDCVMYDGSALPLEQNIQNSRKVVRSAHDFGAVVEGELGRIGGVEEDIVVDEGYASQSSLEESMQYVEQSGIDAFAPAIGTAHGVYKGKPNINFGLVSKLKEAISQPVVIHGGTGLSEDVFRRLIDNGGCKVNVSTALKNAYFDSCSAYLASENPDREPLKLDSYIAESIKSAAAYHIGIFQGGKSNE